MSVSILTSLMSRNYSARIFAVGRVRANTSCISPPRASRLWIVSQEKSSRPLVPVLSDINFAGHGRAGVAWRNQTTSPCLPFITATAYGDDERRRRARELRAFEFITKPGRFRRIEGAATAVAAAAN
jgi:DNA-binding NtrC family response regulator